MRKKIQPSCKIEDSRSGEAKVKVFVGNLKLFNYRTKTENYSNFINTTENLIRATNLDNMTNNNQGGK